MAMPQDEREFQITDSRMGDPLTRADAYLAEAERNVHACIDAINEAMEGDDFDPKEVSRMITHLTSFGMAVAGPMGPRL